MDLGLRGKTALVTGASQGIGKACAAALAREGASIAVAARRAEILAATAEEIRGETGATVFARAADLMEKTDGAELTAWAKQELGRSDILVANIAPQPLTQFDKADDDAWEAVYRMHVAPMVRLIRDVLPGMRERRWGRIVATQSV